MDPKTLVTDKIVEYCKKLQIIFVVGYTKTGKYTIAKELADRLHVDIFISDDFVARYGHKGSLSQLELEIEHCYYSGKPAIFEGILCYRLLRKLGQKGYIYPDLIIKTECNNETIRYFYEKEEPNKNLSRVFGFNQGLEKIWNEYIDLVYSQGKTVKLLNLNTSII